MFILVLKLVHIDSPCGLSAFIFSPTGDGRFLAHFPGEFFFNEDRLTAPWILFGIVHQAGIGGRGGRVNLYLFGQYTERLSGKSLEIQHVCLSTSGMGGDHIIGEELR